MREYQGKIHEPKTKKKKKIRKKKHAYHIN